MITSSPVAIASGWAIPPGWGEEVEAGKEGKEGVLSDSLAEDILGDEATSDEGCGRGPWELCDGDGLLGPPRKRALLGDAVSGKTSIVVFAAFKEQEVDGDVSARWAK